MAAPHVPLTNGALESAVTTPTHNIKIMCARCVCTFVSEGCLVGVRRLSARLCSDSDALGLAGGSPVAASRVQAKVAPAENGAASHHFHVLHTCTCTCTVLFFHLRRARVPCLHVCVHVMVGNARAREREARPRFTSQTTNGVDHGGSNGRCAYESSRSAI